MFPKTISLFFSVFLAATLSVADLVFCSAQEHYQMPPKVMADLIAAPATPQVLLTATRDRILLEEYYGLPSISYLAKEEMGLAGVRFLPAIHGPRVNKKIRRIRVQALPGVKGVQEGPIRGLPDVPIDDYHVSPDGRWVFLLLCFEDRLEPWIAEVSTLEARRIGSRPVNACLLEGKVLWTKEGLIYAAVAASPEKRPERSVPKAPVIQNATGKAEPVRTFQDLLKDENDIALFDDYFTCTLVEVNLQTGKEHEVAPAAIYSDISLSPDANWLLTTQLEKPYSYSVMYINFPTRVLARHLHDARECLIRETDLLESIPFSRGSTRPGHRALGWRRDKPATLFWVEALDGGNGRKEAEYRDALYTWESPFTEGTQQQLARTRMRFSTIQWGDAHHAVVTLSDAKNNLDYTYLINPESSSEWKQLYRVSREEKYAHPGRFVTWRNAMGQMVLYSPDGYKSLMLSGPGYAPEGARPFIDRLDLRTLKTKRLWQSSAEKYQNPAGFVDPGAPSFLYSEESPTEWPNYYLCNLKKKKVARVTAFEDPYPALRGVQKRQVSYLREDGIPLSGTLYLPAGWTPDQGPLPVFMWAYPAEFKSAQTAGQRTDAPNTYIRIRTTGIVPFVTQGYAVFDNASFPIVGEGDAEPNDTYVEQLVMNARAAVNTLVEMGIADPKRIAVGGHSYGSFMTANLLAHCDLFAAGIARSGAHNRTLTPFGFQNERRTFWEAPQVYLKMSPFVYADKLKTPILFIHGMADNNTGTFTMQSERMFAAVKGNGGTARLVLLPCESHGYAAYESVMHMTWETLRWLDTYVKNLK